MGSDPLGSLYVTVSGVWLDYFDRIMLVSRLMASVSQVEKSTKPLDKLFPTNPRPFRHGARRHTNVDGIIDCAATSLSVNVLLQE